MVSQNTGFFIEIITYYFITVKYDMQVHYNGNLVPFFISSSEEINYAAMFDQSVACGVPSYNTVLKVGFEENFKVNPSYTFLN